RIIAVAALAAIFQCAYFGAVAVGTVSAATLITIGSAPIFVVLAEAIRDRRWPGPVAIRPVLTGVLGLTLLIGAPARRASLAASPAGPGLAAISGLAFAGFTMLGRRPLVGIDELNAAGYGFLLGGAALALATVPFAPLGFAVSGRNLGLVLLFATVPTALAYA